MDDVEQNIVICQWRADWLRQIDRDTNKSRHFAITEFNNCFIIQSPSLFFDKYPREAAIFRKIDRKKEKGVVSFTHQQNFCSQTQLDDIAHEQSRNTGHGVVRVDLENMAESCLSFRRKK